MVFMYVPQLHDSYMGDKGKKTECLAKGGSVCAV